CAVELLLGEELAKRLPLDNGPSDPTARKVQQQVAEIDAQQAGKHARNETEFSGCDQYAFGETRQVFAGEGRGGNQEKLAHGRICWRLGTHLHGAAGE